MIAGLCVLIRHKSRTLRQINCHLYNSMFQIFPRDSTLRIHAAKFEYSVENRIECARAIMQEGIRLNPTECSLWTNFVLLELDHVKWLVLCQFSQVSFIWI